jgi:hypothetical protein
VTARRAAVPARVALLAARPDRHNGRALLMARTLAVAGHAVTLYTEAGRAAPDGLPEGVRVDPCLSPQGDGGPAPATAPNGIERVDVANADVVQVEGQAPLRHLAGRLGEGVKLVYDVPGLEPERPAEARGVKAGARDWLQETWLRVGEWFRAPRIDAVLCPGYVFGQFLQRELHLGKVPVVPIYAAHPLREPVRPEAPSCLRPGRAAVALVGGEHGAAAPVVRAVGRVRNVDLVVINGRGDWDALAAEAEVVRMRNRLFRLEIAEEGLIPALAAFQAGLVLPADTTQRALYDLPDALFSFLMAGVPVVASDLPGIEKVVADHNVGALAEPHDEEALADAVGRVCHDGALRDRLLHNVALVRRKR